MLPAARNPAPQEFYTWDSEVGKEQPPNWIVVATRLTGLGQISTLSAKKGIPPRCSFEVCISGRKLGNTRQGHIHP
ncbi:unnamed protein product [Allacma fusca]|uniref:Uncharacterized protein n=1 Tax=Allacma fusca TaxID=39272 RepID=A0A8J2NRQ8_9HEXA|nr:unnamed protein product [Allacma fusca]